MKFIVVICYLLCTAVLSAQDITYYQNLANTTKNKALRLEALDSVLSKSHLKDHDVFVDASESYIALAKELDSIAAAARKAMKLQYTITRYKNNPRRAITLINSVLAEKYKIKDSFLLGGLYLKRGGANANLDLKKAIDDYTLALENFGQKDSIFIADAYLFRGQAYSTLGKFVPAGQNFDLAYKYFEALGDYQYMAFSQQGNITMFSKHGFFEKAKLERDKLIAKMMELGLYDNIATELYNQALDYGRQGKKDLEIQSLKKALANVSEENKGRYTEIIILSAMALYYCTIDEQELAAEKLQEVERYKSNIDKDLYAQLVYNDAKATYLLTYNDPLNALVFANGKLNAARTLGHEDEIMDAHLLLSDVYEKLGNYEKSLQNKNNYLATKDSLYTASSAMSLAYYQTLYETEKQEKELVSKNANIELLERDNSSFRKLMIFIGVALLLTFALILLYRNQLHHKKKKILQEEFSQNLLASQEQERKRISKDLHDGLGQRLLVLKNKLVANGDEESKKMVDTTIEEVRAISRDLHPFQLQELGITKAIQYTLTQIDENTSLFISSEIENIDNLFTPEQEVNIYRIVQESLSNTIKHAQAEASKISVKKLADSVMISIRDNGIGFDFNEKLHNIKSLGLKTLMERTKFLNGRMKVKSKKQAGTLLEFQFPL